MKLAILNVLVRLLGVLMFSRLSIDASMTGNHLTALFAGIYVGSLVYMLLNDLQEWQKKRHYEKLGLRLVKSERFEQITKEEGTDK